MDSKTQQKLYGAVLVIGLLPTIAIFVWGIYQAVQSPETRIELFQKMK